MRSVALIATVLMAGLLSACAEGVVGDGAGERPPVEVEASVDRTSVTTGDRINYTLTVRHGDGWEVEVPTLGDEIGGLEVIDRRAESPRVRRGRRTVDHWYLLRADLVGSYTLPAVTVEGHRPADGSDDRLSVSSAPISIEVESVLPADGSAGDIRDIKPIREIRLWDWRPWAGGLALALVAAVALYLWWRRRRSPRPAEPPVPPHELALERLEALHRRRLEDLAAVRRYYFAISSVVRNYVEGRFGLNATDLTTEEIVDRLQEVAELVDRGSLDLVTFLEQTDAVKYAARTPSQDDIEEVYREALDFVETTRPVDPVEPPAAEEAA